DAGNAGSLQGKSRRSTGNQGVMIFPERWERMKPGFWGSTSSHECVNQGSKAAPVRDRLRFFLSAGQIESEFSSRLLRLQPARPSHATEFQPRWRKFGDHRTTRSQILHAEQLCADQLAGGSLVHGQEVRSPVPAMIAWAVVHANPHLHLGLSP